MPKFSVTNQKLIFIAGFVAALIILQLSTILFGVTYHVILFLIIPVTASLYIFKNRIYLIFAVFMLFAYFFEAVWNNAETDKLIVNIILISVYIVFLGEFIMWIEKKRLAKLFVIKHSEEKYKMLYRFGKIMADTSPDLFWAKDVKGNYLYANKAMRDKMLGAVDLKELIGKSNSFFSERLKNSDNGNAELILSSDSIQDFDSEIISDKKPRRFEKIIKINERSLVFNIYKAPLYNKDGKIIGIMGNGGDVTKEKEEEKRRKQAEMVLRISEQKFRELVENLNEIVYTSDENGKVTYVNNAFEKLTGFPKEVLNQKGPKELIHPDDYDKFMDGIAKVKQNSKVENLEYRAKTALGNYLHFLTTIQSVKSENGKLVGLTGIATDITQIKKAEAEVLSGKKNLDKILSAIPDLLLIFDSEGNYLDVFPQNSNYLLIPFAEGRNKNIKDILPQAIAKEFMTIIKKAISTNQLINYKYTLSINGKNFLFNARVRKINYTGKTAVLWDAHDITAEDKIMKALQENEKKFLNLLNYTYDWEYWIESNGQIGYTSPSCKQQTGYDAEEFTKHHELLSKIVHPNDRKRFIKHLQEEKTSRTSGKIQFKILKKNGEMRVIRHTCQAVFDDGKYIGRRVTNRNATDRWLAEQEQIKSEKKYKSIFNSLIDVYYRIKLDGTVENISPSVEEVSGYKVDEIIGKNAGVFYLNPKLRQELFEETLKSGVLKNYEIEMKDKSGEIKTIAFNNKLIYDESGKPIVVEGMLRDVTQLRKAREELIKTKNEIQNYLSIARVMIIVFDINGIVKLINRKGCKVLGYNEDEIVGKNWFYNFVPKNQREKVKDVFAKMTVKDHEKIKIHENEIINKSGELRTIKWNNAYLENSEGKVTGILSSGEDITTEKKMLSELIESEQNLKELNAAKDKFFSIVSHDIRSPFTALLGFSQILDEDFNELPKEEVIEIVHSLRKISKNIFEFIEGLLEWSRVQSNKIEINPVSVKLYPLVQDVFVLLSAVAMKKNVKILIEIPEKLKVVTDENVVESVLRNLISNAIKFTNTGDTITIYTEDSDNEIIVCVRDTGIGMDEEIINKLFKLDEHVSELGTNKEHGTGLGLLLCRDLLEKQHNKIWAESELNKGSIFKFTLKKTNEY